jgi:hypothetical protein
MTPLSPSSRALSRVVLGSSLVELRRSLIWEKASVGRGQWSDAQEVADGNVLDAEGADRSGGSSRGN